MLVEQSLIYLFFYGVEATPLFIPFQQARNTLILRTRREGPIRCPLYICKSACLLCISVCDSHPTFIAPTDRLFFGMKIGDH